MIIDLNKVDEQLNIQKSKKNKYVVTFYYETFDGKTGYNRAIVESNLSGINQLISFEVQLERMIPLRQALVLNFTLVDDDFDNLRVFKDTRHLLFKSLQGIGEYDILSSYNEETGLYSLNNIKTSGGYKVDGFFTCSGSKYEIVEIIYDEKDDSLCKVLLKQVK